MINRDDEYLCSRWETEYNKIVKEADTVKSLYETLRTFTKDPTEPKKELAKARSEVQMPVVREQKKEHRPVVPDPGRFGGLMPF